MGRKTINIEKIENKIPREYAFVQRKRGLIKKAIELAILCDKEVFFVIHDAKEKKLCHYSSHENFNASKVNQIAQEANYNIEKYCDADLEVLSNPQLTQK